MTPQTNESKWCANIKIGMAQLMLFVAMLVLSPLVILADEVELLNREILSGKIKERSPERLVLDHPILGELTIPMHQIRTIDKKPFRPHTHQIIAPSATNQVPSAQKLPLKEIPKAHWKSQYEFGFNGTKGNRDSVDLRTAVKSEMESKTDRLKFDASYFYSAERATRTKNEFDSGILKDWLLPEIPWFIFSQARYSYDEFEDWDHRVIFNAGVGYDLIKKPRLKSAIRVGAGGSRKFGSAEEDYLEPEGFIGWDLEWKVSHLQKINLATSYYPDLVELSEYRITSLAEWTIKLDYERGLNLKFGAQNEHQSKTEGELQHNDLKFYGALMVEF